MTEQTCTTSCGRPTRDGVAWCEQCRWEVEQALAETPALVEELDTTLSRRAVTTESAGKIDGSGEKPLPFHQQASEALATLRTYLVGWTRDLAGDDPERFPDNDLAAMSGWLLARLSDMAVHPAAADIHSEVVGACRDGWRIVDRAANRTRFLVGPCPEADCAGQVTAYIPTSEDRPARLECAACEQRWETHQWLKVGKRILARMTGSPQRRSAA